MTRDTVFFDTLASRAMSLIVALRPGLMPDGRATAGFAGAGALVAARLPADFFRLRVMGGRLYGTRRLSGSLVL
jgi:hypothetical protein